MNREKTMNNDEQTAAYGGLFAIADWCPGGILFRWSVANLS